MSPFRQTTNAPHASAELSLHFGGTEGGLFSADEVQRLMRIEFERSQRYHYPLSCLLIAVDRLERLHDLYGFELKREILKALTTLVKREVRVSDLLGCMVDDRLQLLIPHSTREGNEMLVRRILAQARKLRFEADGREVHVTLSIGGSHTERMGKLYYETLVQVAEGGLDVANASGGDRYVHSELYEHFQKKLDREGRLPMATEAAEVARTTVDLEELASRPRVEQAPEQPREGVGNGQSEDVDPEAIADYLRDAEKERDELLAERDAAHRRQIDLLERRIGKLTELLSKTEADLAQMAQMKNLDEGIASIYKDVQGLNPEEAGAAVKKELMQQIFEANMELRQTLAGEGAE